MKRLRRFAGLRPIGILIGGLLLMVSELAAGSCAPRDPGVDVAVGTRVAPPFVNKDPILGNGGLALDLWRSIEADLRADGRMGDTQLIECALADQLEALESGALDVVISPLTITAERLGRFDFTAQYLTSGITVAYKQPDLINFGRAGQILADTISQPGVPQSIFLFLLLNLVFAFAIALLMKRNEAFDVVTRDEPRVVFYARAGLETLVRTLGLQALSTEFRGTIAKVFETLLAIIGALLAAAIFGVLTSALISSIGYGDDMSVDRLSGTRIATLNASTSQGFVENLHMMQGGGFAAGPVPVEEDQPTVVRRRIRLPQESRANPRAPGQGAGQTPLSPRRCVPRAGADASADCIMTTSWSQAMALLDRDEVDAVVGDWAQLSFLARSGRFGDSIHVQSSAFRMEPYGWGLNPDRPELRNAINAALLERMRHPQWRGFIQGYLGGGSIGAN